MPLENASKISELVATNPVITDPVGQGDDHLRLLKRVLQDDAEPRLNTVRVQELVSGNNPINVEVPITLTDNGKALGSVQIRANDNDVMPETVSYSADVFISAKTNGVDLWEVSVSETVAPVGFSTAPTISIINDSDDGGRLLIGFTFTAATATGVAKIIF